jgi:enoyl-CoA hydratase
MPVIGVEVKDGVRTITLERPPVNALNGETLSEITTAFTEVADDWDTKVVVLRSALPKYFSAGADMKRPPPTPEQARKDALGVPNAGSEVGLATFTAIYRCPVPVITKIQGVAIGGGAIFGMLSDFMVMGETASIGLFEAKIRAVGGSAIARRVMTEQAMRYLMWSARLLTGRKLRELGCGIHVVPDDAVDAEAAELAEAITQYDRDVVRYTKHAFNEVEGMNPLAAYAIEQKYSSMLRSRQLLGQL